MSSPTLCENGLDAPKGCAGKSKPAQAGRVLQKVSTLLIHVLLLVAKILVSKDADYSTPVRLADEAAAVARRLRGPAASDAPAENRWTQHGAFETGTPVDVATGHACDLACGIEPGDRFEVLVEHAALKVGLDTAEVFARQREDLNRVIRRRVERLR